MAVPLHAEEAAIDRSQPPAVHSPLGAAVNRAAVPSEKIRSLAESLPNKPTSGQLEKSAGGGLLLRSTERDMDRKGEEETALSEALKEHEARSRPEDATALEAFISSRPESPWTPGLRVTCGRQLYHQGRFSEALDQFEKSWAALKDSTDPVIREASVSAAAELASLYARLGRREELHTLLKEIEGRPVSGENTEKIRMAAEGLDAMIHHPEHSFKCGPYALRGIRETLGLQPFLHPLIRDKESCYAPN